MAFTPKNQPQISQEAADALTSEDVQPNADVGNGTVTRDIIDVVASQVSEAYDTLQDNKNAAYLQNASTTNEDALSQIALNFDVLRAAATYATGTVTFQTKTLPSVAINIPLGTLVWTSPLPDGSIIKYRTTESATLPITATKNQLTGYYEVNVAVQADVAGTESHVGVNSLVEIPNRVPGITAATNKIAINNATDADTNTVLAESIREKTAGIALGTAQGYIDLITSEFSDEVSGVAVAGPFDPDNDRVQFGNEVDIPIITADATSFTTIVTTNGAPDTLLSAVRPVVSVSTVLGTTNGTLYQNGVHYGFKRDTSVVYGYSSRSFDALCWFPSHQPGPGLQLTVQGTQDAVVRDVQDFLNNPSRRYVTADLLVKTAQQILIDMTMDVSAQSGVDRTQLAADIRSAITTLLADYDQGDDVLQDDVVRTVQDVDGVDFVEIPFSVFKKSTDSSGADTSIEIRKQEFARIGTLTINVT